ncbi:MAG: MerR family transcriptional regulator [Thermodesulfobacteriota bacterium]
MENNNKEMLKIGELARESGFPVSTIRHYLNVGLLGAPRQKNKNMAYYGRDILDRLSLIKRLKDELLLPLGQIRNILNASPNLSLEEMDRFIEIRRRLETDSDLLPCTGIIPEEEIVINLHLTREELAVMEDMGVVRPVRKGGAKFFTELDYRIIKAFSDCREAGLTAEIGFPADDLIIFLQAIRDLVKIESRVFMSRVKKIASADLIASLIKKGLPAVENLIGALHSKYMMEVMEDLESGLPGGSKPR